VGAFLSGGLDSTCLVTLMTKLGGRQLKTFSIGFDEAGYSEAAAAAENARYLGTEHHATILTGQQVAGDIGRIIAGMDHPTGDGINTYYVSQAARQGGVTVSLSGLGADELFGGYPSFKNITRMARWRPVWLLLPVMLRNSLLTRWSAGNTQQRKLADMLRHGKHAAALAMMQRRVFAESTRQALFNPEIDSAYAAHPAEALLAEELADLDLQALNSAAELSGYMADVLLRDSDMMSMRHSLELRVPFVDRPLITWVAAQPSACKFTPHNPKSVLAAALDDVLPPAIHQRSKRGFTLPFAQWMLSPLRPFLEEIFSTRSVQQTGFFSAPAVQAQWLRFLSNTDSREWSRVWSLAMLIAFINRPRPAAA
jgi:asparagine synthase (glutamine-hydrolysing)